MSLLTPPGLSQARAARLLAPRTRIVAGKGCVMRFLGGGPSDSNYAMNCCRMVTRTGPSTTRNLRLVYTNGYADANGEVNGPNAITVKAGLEVLADDGTTKFTLPLAFNGSLSASIAGNAGVAITDPIGIALPPNALIAIRSELTVNAGEQFPTGIPTHADNQYVGGPSPLGGENFVKFAAGSPTLVYSTGFFASTGGSSTYGYGPLAIIGETDGPSPAVAIVGDSIGRGSGDSVSDEIMAGMHAGFIGRAMATQLTSPGAVTPFVQLARDSASISFMNSVLKGADKARLLLPLQWCTHVVCEMGNNDIAGSPSLSTMQQRYITLWSYLKSQGLRVWQTTLTPRVTGTYSSAAGQIISANYGPGQLRDLVNAWLVSSASQYIDGVIDVNPAVEDPANPGKWRSDVVVTADGVHPNSSGHKLMAALVRVVARTWTV